MRAAVISSCAISQKAAHRINWFHMDGMDANQLLIQPTNDLRVMRLWPSHPGNPKENLRGSLVQVDRLRTGVAAGIVFEDQAAAEVGTDCNSGDQTRK